jgi:hypothetical protein
VPWNDCVCVDVSKLFVTGCISCTWSVEVLSSQQDTFYLENSVANGLLTIEGNRHTLSYQGTPPRTFTRLFLQIFMLMDFFIITDDHQEDAIVTVVPTTQLAREKNFLPSKILSEFELFWFLSLSLLSHFFQRHLRVCEPTSRFCECCTCLPTLAGPGRPQNLVSALSLLTPMLYYCNTVVRGSVTFR